MIFKLFGRKNAILSRQKMFKLKTRSLAIESLEERQLLAVDVTSLMVGDTNALQISSGNGWSFDTTTDELTLNGYSGGKIEAVGDLTINVTDKSSLVQCASMEDSITVKGDLTLTGNSTLRLQGGFRHSGTLDVSASSVKVWIGDKMVTNYVSTFADLQSTLTTSGTKLVLITGNFSASSMILVGSNTNVTIISSGDWTIERNSDYTSDVLFSIGNIRNSSQTIDKTAIVSLGSATGMGTCTLTISGGAVWDDITNLSSPSSPSVRADSVTSKASLIYDAGKLYLYDGAILTNNYNSNYKDKIVDDTDSYNNDVAGAVFVAGVDPSGRLGAKTFEEIDSETTFTRGELIIEGGIISNNWAQRGSIVVYGALKMDGGLIYHNVAYCEGGGILSRGYVFINGGSIDNNYCTMKAKDTSLINGSNTSKGGGIHNSSYAYLKITGGTISNNYSASRGGGIYVGGSGKATTIFGDAENECAGPVIENNTALYGGGIYVNSTLEFYAGTIRYNDTLAEYRIKTVVQAIGGSAMYVMPANTSDLGKMPYIIMKGNACVDTNNTVYIYRTYGNSNTYFIPIKVIGNLTTPGVVMVITTADANWDSSSMGEGRPIIRFDLGNKDNSYSTTGVSTADYNFTQEMSSKFVIANYKWELSPGRTEATSTVNKNRIDAKDCLVLSKTIHPYNYHARVGNVFFRTYGDALTYIEENSIENPTIFITHNTLIVGYRSYTKAITVVSETEETRNDLLYGYLFGQGTVTAAELVTWLKSKDSTLYPSTYTIASLKTALENANLWDSTWDDSWSDTTDISSVAADFIIYYSSCDWFSSNFKGFSDSYAITSPESLTYTITDTTCTVTIPVNTTFTIPIAGTEDTYTGTITTATSMVFDTDTKKLTSPCTIVCTIEGDTKTYTFETGSDIDVTFGTDVITSLKTPKGLAAVPSAFNWYGTADYTVIIHPNLVDLADNGYAVHQVDANYTLGGSVDVTTFNGYDPVSRETGQLTLDSLYEYPFDGVLYNVKSGNILTINEKVTIKDHRNTLAATDSGDWNLNASGAISVKSGGTLTMNGGTIENCAGSMAGAIVIEKEGTVNLNASDGQATTLFHNESGQASTVKGSEGNIVVDANGNAIYTGAGAIYNYGGTLLIQNADIDSNIGHWGGICNVSPAGTITSTSSSGVITGYTINYNGVDTVLDANDILSNAKGVLGTTNDGELDIKSGGSISVIDGSLYYENGRKVLDSGISIYKIVGTAQYSGTTTTTTLETDSTISNSTTSIYGSIDTGLLTENDTFVVSSGNIVLGTSGDYSTTLNSVSGNITNDNASVVFVQGDTISNASVTLSDGSEITDATIEFTSATDYTVNSSSGNTVTTFTSGTLVRSTYTDTTLTGGTWTNDGSNITLAGTNAVVVLTDAQISKGTSTTPFDIINNKDAGDYNVVLNSGTISINANDNIFVVYKTVSTSTAQSIKYKVGSVKTFSTTTVAMSDTTLYVTSDLITALKTITYKNGLIHNKSSEIYVTGTFTFKMNEGDSIICNNETITKSYSNWTSGTIVFGSSTASDNIFKKTPTEAPLNLRNGGTISYDNVNSQVQLAYTQAQVELTDGTILITSQQVSGETYIVTTLYNETGAVVRLPDGWSISDFSANADEEGNASVAITGANLSSVKASVLYSDNKTGYNVVTDYVASIDLANSTILFQNGQPVQLNLANGNTFIFDIGEDYHFQINQGVVLRDEADLYPVDIVDTQLDGEESNLCIIVDYGSYTADGTFVDSSSNEYSFVNASFSVVPSGTSEYSFTMTARGIWDSTTAPDLSSLKSNTLYCVDGGTLVMTFDGTPTLAVTGSANDYLVKVTGTISAYNVTYTGVSGAFTATGGNIGFHDADVVVNSISNDNTKINIAINNAIMENDFTTLTALAEQQLYLSCGYILTVGTTDSITFTPGTGVKGDWVNAVVICANSSTVDGDQVSGSFSDGTNSYTFSNSSVVLDSKGNLTVIAVMDTIFSGLTTGPETLNLSDGGVINLGTYTGGSFSVTAGAAGDTVYFTAVSDGFKTNYSGAHVYGSLDTIEDSTVSTESFSNGTLAYTPNACQMILTCTLTGQWGAGYSTISGFNGNVHYGSGTNDVISPDDILLSDILYVYNSTENKTTVTITAFLFKSLGCQSKTRISYEEASVGLNNATVTFGTASSVTYSYDAYIKQNYQNYVDSIIGSAVVYLDGASTSTSGTITNGAVFCNNQGEITVTGTFQYTDGEGTVQTHTLTSSDIVSSITLDNNSDRAFLYFENGQQIDLSSGDSITINKSDESAFVRYYDTLSIDSSGVVRDKDDIVIFNGKGNVFLEVTDGTFTANSEHVHTLPTIIEAVTAMSGGVIRNNSNEYQYLEVDSASDTIRYNIAVWQMGNFYLGGTAYIDPDNIVYLGGGRVINAATYDSTTVTATDDDWSNLQNSNMNPLTVDTYLTVMGTRLVSTGNSTVNPGTILTAGTVQHYRGKTLVQEENINGMAPYIIIGYYRVFYYANNTTVENIDNEKVYPNRVENEAVYNEDVYGYNDMTSTLSFNQTGFVPGDGTYSTSSSYFVGWNTTRDGSGIWYNEGDSMTITSTTKLYAIWSSNVVNTLNDDIDPDDGYTSLREAMLYALENENLRGTADYNVNKSTIVFELDSTKWEQSANWTVIDGKTYFPKIMTIDLASTLPTLYGAIDMNADNLLTVIEEQGTSYTDPEFQLNGGSSYRIMRCTDEVNINMNYLNYYSINSLSVSFYDTLNTATVDFTNASYTISLPDSSSNINVVLTVVVNGDYSSNPITLASYILDHTDYTLTSGFDSSCSYAYSYDDVNAVTTITVSQSMSKTLPKCNYTNTLEGVITLDGTAYSFVGGADDVTTSYSIDENGNISELKITKLGVYVTGSIQSITSGLKCCNLVYSSISNDGTNTTLTYTGTGTNWYNSRKYEGNISGTFYEDTSNTAHDFTGATLIFTPQDNIKYMITAVVDGDCSSVDINKMASNLTITGSDCAGEFILDTANTVVTALKITKTYDMVNNKTTIIFEGVKDNDDITRTYDYEAEGTDASYQQLLQNLTYINGKTTSNGGAFYIQNGKIQLKNCTFKDNVSSNNGGAIANRYGTVILTGCTITSTQDRSSAATASYSAGYALSNFNAKSGGGIYNTGTMTLDSCTISNLWVNKNGGAIVNNASTDAFGVLTIKNSVFLNNTAWKDGDSTIDLDSGYGGALGNWAEATIINSTFSGNTAEINGGAITSGYKVYGSGTDVRYSSLTIQGGTTVGSKTLFFGNNAQYGGAIINGTSLSINTGIVQFIDNTASKNGGAIHNTYYTNRGDNKFPENDTDGLGTITISGTGSDYTKDEIYFVNNTAEGYGGAICSNYDFTASEGNPVSINHTTFHGNSATTGGALAAYEASETYNSGTVKFITETDTVYSFTSVNNVQSSLTIDLGAAMNLSKNQTCYLQDNKGGSLVLEEHTFLSAKDLGLSSGQYSYYGYIVNSDGIRSGLVGLTLNVIDPDIVIQGALTDYQDGQLVRLDAKAILPENKTAENKTAENKTTVQEWRINWGDSDQVEVISQPSSVLAAFHYYSQTDQDQTYYINLEILDSNGKTSSTYYVGSHTVLAAVAEAMVLESAPVLINDLWTADEALLSTVSEQEIVPVTPGIEDLLVLDMTYELQNKDKSSQFWAFNSSSLLESVPSENTFITDRSGAVIPQRRILECKERNSLFENNVSMMDGNDDALMSVLSESVNRYDSEESDFFTLLGEDIFQSIGLDD